MHLDHVGVGVHDEAHLRPPGYTMTCNGTHQPNGTITQVCVCFASGRTKVHTRVSSTSLLRFSRGSRFSVPGLGYSDHATWTTFGCCGGGRTYCYNRPLWRASEGVLPHCPPCTSQYNGVGGCVQRTMCRHVGVWRCCRGG